MENITLAQIQAIIVGFSTLLTAGGVILTFALKSVKKIIKSEMTPLCDSVQAEVKKLQDDNRAIHKELIQNSLDTMRIAICSEELPLKERIEIGDRYIDAGGNGSVKVRVKKLKEDYEKELRKEVRK